jgi:6-phosphofructokinase 1
MVVECMGRHAGWITAYAGVAAGAEAILVPERPVQIAELCRKLAKLRATGVRAAIIAAAEGARVFDGEQCLSSTETDEYGQCLTGGIAQLVARRVQAELGWEARPLVLGHLQRAGRPIAFDRLFALRLGAKAARLVLERRFGYMAALRAGEVVDVPLSAAVATRRTLPAQFLDRYESFFLPSL